MDFDNPTQLEGIGDDGIIIHSDVSHQELQLAAAVTGDYGITTTGGTTHFTLDDPTHSVGTSQDGVMSYIIQGTEESTCNLQHVDCLVEPHTIPISQENLSIQVPNLVKVNVPTVDSSSGLTSTQSVYITLSQDGQVTVKKEQEDNGGSLIQQQELPQNAEISQPQIVAQDGNITLVNVAGNSEMNASSKTQSSLVQLTQDGKVNIVSKQPAVPQQLQLQQVMLPNGTVAYLNMSTNMPENQQFTVGENCSTTMLPNATKVEGSSIESVGLDDGSITYITASMVPEAADLGDTSLCLSEATSLQKVPDGDECSNGSEEKTVDGSDLVDAELPNLLADQGTCMVESNKVTDKTLTEKAFKCPFNGCDRYYTTVHHLKVHERTHTGDKPYHCSQDDCGKAFATAYGLKSHTRIHTGEKPYECPMDQCTKAFKTSGDLQKHIRTHTGEKPFKCPFEGCNKSFTTSNIRKVHIRVHTGERPYVCPIDGCGKSFSSATNYKNHIRIHTGERPYVCSVQGCGKKFTEYSSLYKHHVVHTHAKPYVCQFCGKTYRQTSTLAMHIRTAHGDEATLPDAEYVLARDRIFTVGVEDNEGALVINTAEPNQGSAGSTSTVADTSHTTPATSKPVAINSVLNSNINVIQAPPGGGNIVSLPSELQGQRVFVITEPAQLQLLQQLTQTNPQLKCETEGESTSQLCTVEMMDTPAPDSPTLIVGSGNEPHIV